MSVHGSRFAKLIELAQVTSSEQRRELLREVTDLFFETSEERNDTTTAMFDDILRTVAADMQDTVLVELASRFADADEAPMQLLRDLANHKFEIAQPVLQRSRLLTEDHLVEIASKQSQEHLRVVAGRADVSERLSRVLVQKGDDTTVNTLIRNEQAKIARDTFETVVDRAKSSSALHADLVKRREIPLDLLNEMMFVVEARLRQAIVERNASVPAADLEAALSKCRSRIAAAAGLPRAELERAEKIIADKKAVGQLTPLYLIDRYRDRQTTLFLVGLADLTGLEVETLRQMVARRDMDALAMVCRASGFERPIFVTIAVLLNGGEKAMSRAEAFGHLYNQVPVEAAQRAMRFFKVRKSSESQAA